MKNENKTDEMVDILSHLHQYVPMRIETKVINVIRGAQSMRKNSTHASGRLDDAIKEGDGLRVITCWKF